jgi:hypothetical protein
MYHTLKVVLNVMKTALPQVNLKNAGALDLCPSSMNLDNTKILSCECARGKKKNPKSLCYPIQKEMVKDRLMSKQVQSIHFEHFSIASDF